MPKSATPKQPQPQHKTTWAQLTWDELETWAGSSSLKRGKRYASAGRVSDLTIAEDQSLHSKVRGTARYTVQVPAPRGGRLTDSSCSCPVGYRCKHAVATIVAYLDALAGGTPVPAAKADDRRRKSVRKAHEVDEGDGWREGEIGEHAGYDDENDDDEDSGEPTTWSSRRRQKTAPRAAAAQSKSQSLRAIVAAKDRGQLIDLVLEFALRHPELAKRLTDESLLASGDATALIEATRRELRLLTAKQSWWHHWERRGSLPNFGPLQEKFERLRQLGLANHLLQLGAELLERGIRQVEQSDDEGHVAGEIRSCLDLAFDALPDSGLGGSEQLLFAIYAMLVDDFDLCAGARQVLDRDLRAADWSQAADVLLERIRRPQELAAGGEFRRMRLVDFAVRALQSAGRVGEILPLAEHEARTHHEYQRLITLLFERTDLPAAEAWLRTALQNTDPRLHGLVAGYRRQLCEIATRRKDWPTVAGHAAELFFEQPSVETLQELLRSAAKAGCEGPVRAGALLFLETGARPAGGSAIKTGNEPPREHSWPLTAPDYIRVSAPAKSKTNRAMRAFGANRPRPDVLLDLAMAEKRPDDALALYDRHFSQEAVRARGMDYIARHAPSVAQFVAPTHPKRAAELYEALILANVNQVGESFYEQAVAYLKAMRPITAALGAPERWDSLMARIRNEQR
ncbi:MAG TPA: SWIM zinc finger family protein, partial [Pirellulaceae bacterium]|nr:SWIM zinc finger family protein [Pirellulaceae bacterium]